MDHVLQLLRGLSVTRTFCDQMFGTMMFFTLFYLYVASKTKGVCASTVHLSPAIVNVVEKTSVTLTCSKTNGQLSETRWTNSQISDQNAILIYYNGQCMMTRFLQNNDLFHGVCNGNGTFSVILNRIDRLQHGAVWQCKEALLASNKVTVNVAVPLTNVGIYVPGGIYLNENHQYIIKCYTSACRPKPTISWYLEHPKTHVKYSLTENSTQSTTEMKYGLVAAESLLRLVPNRTVNDWMLYCEAWTDNTYYALASKQKALNVSYPPDGGPVLNGYESSKTYQFIEGDQVEFSCLVTGGNPLATLSWNCSNSIITSTTVVNKTVLSSVTLKAVRHQNVCSCESHHTFNGKEATNVTLDVLYPPDIPKISVLIDKDDKVTATERINIIEKETIELECYSNSRPKARYTWLVNATHTLQKNVFKLINISRKDAGNYTCHVNNLMNRTFGVAAAGVNSSSILINILYPAFVGSLAETSLNEASALNITCPVIQGNPTVTRIFWTRKRDNSRWNSSQLIILNVTRADDTIYTCTVFNEMVPTVGEITLAEKSSQFHLNVFFPAVIKTFFAFGEDSREAIVVNETEEVSFHCTAEANPASDITIRSPQYEQIAVVLNTNTLIHTLQNASCVNAGEYVCSCRNNYTNGHASSLKLVLIVRCPPKPSSDNAKDGKIAVILYADVTLQITARNYLDVPNQTVFMWFKENATIENDERKFIMSSHGLQSNLSITNITQTDLGKYGVRVSNSVGQYIRMYELVGQDKLEAPKNFVYINDSITDSSVALKWMPGFNGGFPQTFVLLFKRITEQQWQNKYINDNGNKEMNFTLVDLFSMTEYQVKMFARNEEGSSAYTESLQFTTKAPVSIPIESHSSTIGIVAGSVSSSVIIVTIAGIAVVVWIYRKRLKQKNEHNVRQTTGTTYETESSFTYDGLDVSKREGNTYSQLPATYEQLDNVTKEGSTYTEMENTKLKREDPDYINIRI